MTVAYRCARPQDAAQLDRIFDTSFRETFAHLYRPEDLAAFLAGFDISGWEAQIRDPAYAFRIAEVDGEPVGYVKLGPLKLPVETAHPAIMLDQLYILKGHHGTGIAHALMDWAMDEARARAAQQMYLTVYTENYRARRFYERYGFEEVGPYRFMVGEQADEDIIMRVSV